MRPLYYILLYFVSASEFVICYYLLFHTILDKESLNKYNKAAVIMSIVLPSVLLTVNRGVTFFSDIIFIFITALFCLAVCAIMRRDFILLCSYIWLYHTLIALCDICFAFFSMAFLKMKFLNLIYCQVTSLWQIIIYIAARGVVFILVRWIIKSEWKIGKEYIFTFILIDVLLFWILKKYQLYMDEMALGEIYMDGTNGGFSLLAVMVVIALIIILFLKNQVMQKENKFLELHDQMTEQSYQMLRCNIEANHQLVHDMKHHLLFLRKLAEEGDIRRVSLYLDEIEKEYIEVKEAIWTGNRFLDFILNQKRQKAENEGITFIISSEIIPEWNLTENEMSVMFGNLLDNAIEACEKINHSDKWIKISFMKRASIIVIQIGNSIGSYPTIRQDRIISDKQNPHLHGYGLKSVRRIVEGQEGCMNWRVSEHEFYIDITFFNSDRRKEGKA